MKPKTYIRITSTDDDNDINERNTYYFITTKLPKARIRKEIKNDLDVITTEKLWQVEIVGMELIKELEDTNMPNYTITQPKTQFFNRYRKILEETFLTNKYITQNYSGATVLQVEANNLKTTMVLQPKYQVLWLILVDMR